MNRSIAKRREKLTQDMNQLVADAEHWNRMHPDEEPIVIDTDISKEVAARLATMKPKGAA